MRAAGATRTPVAATYIRRFVDLGRVATGEPFQRALIARRLPVRSAVAEQDGAMTQMPQVAVHADARREVVPDSFEIVVRVACRSADADAAMAALTTGFERVEETIDALPVPEVVARRGAVSQRRILWEQNPAWLASRIVRLTGRDIERAGDVIAPIADLSGAVDGLELTGPIWQLDPDNPVHAQLQAEAVREARARAQRYAAALGGTLGPLIELADPTMDRGPVAFAARSAGHADGFETMDYSPVPIEVQAGVDGRWALVLP
jgi:uncharacterized protein YggE